MKISNEGGQGELTHEKREVTAGEERGKPGGRRTYAAGSPGQLPSQRFQRSPRVSPRGAKQGRMVDSRRSACKKLNVVAIIVVVVMFVSFLLYFFLPARQEKQEVVEKTSQEGDNNTVTTIQEKEVSIVHIEGLQKGQTTGYLFTVGGILLILLTLGGMGFHYKVLGAPRRLKKDLEREQLLDRIHDIEEILVDLGHMKKKQVRFMGKKNKKGKKVQEQIHAMEEGSEDDDEEE